MSRYIDADRLYKDITRSIDYCEDILEIVERQPAADVAEVRHGKWKYEAGFKYKRGGRNTEAKQIFGTEWRTMQRLKCSVCGMVVLVDDTIKYEYCPHCGARCEE